MFDDLERAIQVDLDDLRTMGHMSRAAQLSTANQRFYDDTMPQYFTGKLEAPVVLVHLNPKQDDDYPKWSAHCPRLNNVREYVDHFRNFGKSKYGADSTGDHKSPFDHKQIHFLRPFGAIDFEDNDDVDPRARRRNLERVVDDKLQLEIVPYGSSKFRAAEFKGSILDPCWDRALEVIMDERCQRQFVIFCGSVFGRFLNRYIIEMHEFYLPMSAGRAEKQKSRFANVSITRQRDGRILQAGWAPSFSRQGIPMNEYGRKCAKLYRRV